MANHLLTVAQVADAIGKSNKTVYRYIKDRKIIAEKNGFGYLVHRGEVVRYLRSEQRVEREKWQARVDRVRVA